MFVLAFLLNDSVILESSDRMIHCLSYEGMLLIWYVAANPIYFGNYVNSGHNDDVLFATHIKNCILYS
jgi:hypothetical protein